MSKLYIMIGIQGSGKSSLAKTIEGVHLSSDSLRAELYGEESIQGDPKEIFAELERRALFYLTHNKDVIYDATNVNRKRRIALINLMKSKVSNLKVVAVYMNTPYEVAVENNKNRDRVVPEEIIKRTYKSLQVPTYSEGFSEIKIISKTSKLHSPSLFFKINTYEDYKKLLSFLDLKECIEYDQNNPHHNFTLSRHMYNTLLVTKEKSSSPLVQIAAMLHDIGKPFCKEQKGEYSRYYSHDNVSAQKAVSLLASFDILDEDILYIAELIQNHMRIRNVLESGDKSLKKLKEEIGQYQLIRLLELHYADDMSHTLQG